MGEGASTGTDRTARVLEPGFVEGLGDLSIEELWERRDVALLERDFQSYLRRLVQVRQDLLLAEERRRAAGEAPMGIVERITTVLADGPRGGSRGEVLRVKLTDEDLSEASRRAEELMGDLAGDVPLNLEDAELAGALARLERAERTVSADRRGVLDVHDAVQEELKRRYRQDPTLALQRLPNS
jgi:hypothetical protein